MATKLLLELSNQRRETAVASHQVFEQYCAELFRRALLTDMPVKIHVAILLAKPLVYPMRGATITVKVHVYNNLEQWHDVTFEIAKVPSKK